MHKRGSRPKETVLPAERWGSRSAGLPEQKGSPWSGTTLENSTMSWNSSYERNVGNFCMYPIFFCFFIRIQSPPRRRSVDASFSVRYFHSFNREHRSRGFVRKVEASLPDCRRGESRAWRSHETVKRERVEGAKSRSSHAPLGKFWKTVRGWVGEWLKIVRGSKVDLSAYLRHWRTETIVRRRMVQRVLAFTPLPPSWVRFAFSRHFKMRDRLIRHRGGEEKNSRIIFVLLTRSDKSSDRLTIAMTKKKTLHVPIGWVSAVWPLDDWTIFKKVTIWGFNIKSSLIVLVVEKYRGSLEPCFTMFYVVYTKF